MPWMNELLSGDDSEPLGDIHDPDYVLRYLVGLPPTVRVQAEHRVEAMRASPRGKAQAVALEYRLKLCAQRDELAAERPAGCWCLGLGGRHPRYTQSGIRLFDEVCDCREGRKQELINIGIRRENQALMHSARAARLFGDAGVPRLFHGCTFDTFPVSERTQEALATVKAWSASASPPKRSLMVHGPYGTGKTGLAAAIAHEWTEREWPVLFFTVPTLLDHIRRTYGSNAVADEGEVVESVKTAPNLILDDLGAERVTDWVREKLFTIINHRHDEDLATVFTSNLDIGQLGEHIGERTTWRIVEMCEVVKLDGPNLRDRSYAAHD